MTEGDQLIEQRTDHLVTHRGQPGIVARWQLTQHHRQIRVIRRSLIAGIDRWQHRQTTDFGTQQQALSGLGKREGNKRLAALRIARPFDQTNAGWRDGTRPDIGEIDRKPGVFTGQGQEIDHRPQAETTARNTVRGVKSPRSDRRAIAGNLQNQRPSLLPAKALQDRLDDQVRGRGARSGRHHDMAEIRGAGKIGPTRGHFQTTCREIRPVPHDAVTEQRLTAKKRSRIIDGQLADFFWNVRVT